MNKKWKIQEREFRSNESNLYNLLSLSRKLEEAFNLRIGQKIDLVSGRNPLNKKGLDLAQVVNQRFLDTYGRELFEIPSHLGSPSSKKSKRAREAQLRRSEVKSPVGERPVYPTYGGQVKSEGGGRHSTKSPSSRRNGLSKSALGSRKRASHKPYTSKKKHCKKEDSGPKTHELVNPYYTGY